MIWKYIERVVLFPVVVGAALCCSVLVFLLVIQKYIFTGEKPWES